MKGTACSGKYRVSVHQGCRIKGKCPNRKGPVCLAKGPAFILRVMSSPEKSDAGTYHDQKYARRD